MGIFFGAVIAKSLRYIIQLWWPLMSNLLADKLIYGGTGGIVCPTKFISR